MMDGFKLIEISSNLFFHYKSMLKDILSSLVCGTFTALTLYHGPWVSWAISIYVSRFVFYYSTGPLCGFATKIKSVPGLIKTLSSTKRMLPFPDSIFVTIKHLTTKFALQFNKFTLPEMVSISPYCFRSPFPVTYMITEKMFTYVDSIFVNIELFFASFAIYINHDNSMALIYLGVNVEENP